MEGLLQPALRSVLRVEVLLQLWFCDPGRQVHFVLVVHIVEMVIILGHAGFAFQVFHSCRLHNLPFWNWPN